MAGKLVNLLFVDDHLTEVAQISKSMRQLGMVVRDTRVDGIEAFREALGKMSPDLIFFGLHLSEPTLSAIHEAATQSAVDAAVIAVTHGAPCVNRAPVLRQGARDVVDSEDTELLLQVCERELLDMRTRRDLVELKFLLKDANDRCDSLLDSSREAIAYIHEGAHVYVNAAYLELFGYQEATQLEGLPLMNMVCSGDRDTLRQLLRDFAKGKTEHDHQEMEASRADGSSFQAELILRQATVEGEPCIQVMFRDAAEVVDPELEHKLAELHQRDILTGLYNRQYFKTLLDESFASGEGTILYILLDHYRQICEQYGLTTGDRVVKEIAEVVNNGAGEDSITARFSDSVMVVLTPAMDDEQVLQLSESIRRAVDDHVVLADSRMITTTCCIGVCSADEQMADAGEMISAADQACEAARTGEGNGIKIYQRNAHDGAGAITEEILRAALQTAIDENRVSLSFQPIASISGATGERYAVSTVVEVDGQYLTAEDAFPGAADLGLISTLDEWTIARACRVLADAKGGKVKTSLLVPIAASTLTDKSRRDAMLAQIVADCGLVVEVAEPLAEQYYRQSLDLARSLHAHGAQLAINHFGTNPNAARLIGLLQPSFIRFSDELTADLSSNQELRTYMDQITETMRTVAGETIVGAITSAQQMAGIWQTRTTLIMGDFVAEPREVMEFDFEQFVA